MTTELMKAFDFTAEDLAFNKMQQLSPRQTRRLKKNRGQTTVGLTLFMLAIGTGAVFTLLPFIRQTLSITDDVGRLIGGVVLAGLSLIILFLLLMGDEEPVVKSVRGKAQFLRKESDVDNEVSSTSYYVVIGEREFVVERDKYQALTQGHIYTIYSAVGLGILSIEYIGPPGNRESR